ncbi:MAG: GNAT family N-acetyltransferase [Streptosporangiaceae bacterium]
MSDHGGPDGEWRIEAHAVRAWPAATALSVDGWLLRHTPGVLRRRSNSVLPPLRPSLAPSSAGEPDPPAGPPEQAIARVEEYYAGLGLPVVVQVTPAGRRGDLDAILAGRGYARAAPTVVLTAPAVAVAAGTATHDDLPGQVEVTDGLDPEWSLAFAALDDHRDSALVAEAVIGRIALPVGCARLRIGAEIAGMGLFVGGGRYAGAFCIATAPGHRRRGVASAIMAAGARWAAGRGSQTLYLQVEEANAAARSLYDRLGFAASHGYHYRVVAPPAG